MANNTDEQIVLGLNIAQTVSQINADIKKLQKQLKPVETTCTLDTSTTVKQINFLKEQWKKAVSALSSGLSADTVVTKLISNIKETVKKLNEDKSEQRFCPLWG